MLSFSETMGERELGEDSEPWLWGKRRFEKSEASEAGDNGGGWFSRVEPVESSLFSLTKSQSHTPTTPRISFQMAKGGVSSLRVIYAGVKCDQRIIHPFSHDLATQVVGLREKV